MENSTVIDIRSGIREFWTWLEQGSQDHTETLLEVDTHESNDDTATVTQDETMIEAGARESNTDTPGVTQTKEIVASRARDTNTSTTTVSLSLQTVNLNTSKGKVAGEKRKRGRGR
jgi:hypothetical protein